MEEFEEIGKIVGNFLELLDSLDFELDDNGEIVQKENKIKLNLELENEE